MWKDEKIFQIEPSLLASDFGFLADEAKRAEEAGADALHLDVMDGHFVPNLTMGPKIVAAINRATDLFLDVHLMIYNPFEYVERFIESGADRLTFHFEATEEVLDTLKYIRACNIEAGLAFCPETSMSMIPKYLDQCDLILIMTVHPGFGGQAFMPDMLEKIRFTRQTCEQLRICSRGRSAETEEQAKQWGPMPIQVDGGIDEQTAAECAKAGATHFVAGTSLFSQESLKKGIQKMRQSVVASSILL